MTLKRISLATIMTIAILITGLTPVQATVVAAPSPLAGLPLRTETFFGLPSDPVNLAFEGTSDSISAAFLRIGWVVADPPGVINDALYGEAILEGTPDPAAPVSNLYYLDHQPQDFAVEHQLGSLARRDHARFWDVNRVDPATGLEVIVGTASRDVRYGLLCSRFHFRFEGKKHCVAVGVTHRIDPNIDASRNLIVADLRKAGLVVSVRLIPGVGRLTGSTGRGDTFRTDGKIALLVIKTI